MNLTNKCEVVQCNKKRKIHSNFCSTHANQNNNWGHPTLPKISWKKTLKPQREWISGYIKNRLDDAELNHALEWIEEYCRYFSTLPGLHQKYLKRVYEQTRRHEYIEILAAAVALTAYLRTRNNISDQGKRYLLHLGDIIFFATTTPSSTSRSLKTGNPSTSFYSPANARLKVARDFTEQLGPLLSLLANKLNTLSPLRNL